MADSNNSLRNGPMLASSTIKPIWRKVFTYDWKFGLFLILLICIPRFFLVLMANQTGNYGPIGAIMFGSALIPFIFLSGTGRAEIGIKSPKRPKILLLGLIAGIIFSLVLYYIGKTLFDGSLQNWYVYIGQSYNIPEQISADDKRILFGIMASTGMIFSPIGEELFFRGIVHGTFARSVGDKKASNIDSTAFALTHIAHFGLVYHNGHWDFYFLPTLLWVCSMFLVSRLFFKMKELSGSLLAAIVCHAGFNLGMIYSIFYLL
ncbi:CPBP family intramembrane glutamic endopeptidase [Persicobacter diffluens]|uniref:CAAX prenyl protease 2/Lysostaphin resistance protein A-like domain-containing protein n=1 Tax=Persicobacter diffluens TaxID=981 RepID=A0AAN5AMK8_9BACT|nr:hypothetical protein PEDI_44640 [Persicobacter diffluens]